MSHATETGISSGSLLGHLVCIVYSSPSHTNGPLQLGSCDHNFPKNLLHYGLLLKECQKQKDHFENTKIAKFEDPSIKE